MAVAEHSAVILLDVMPEMTGATASPVVAANYLLTVFVSGGKVTAIKIALYRADTTCLKCSYMS
jgi:hypothetical protein